MPRVVCAIQARMGSSRLPGKILLDLAGQSVLTWVLEKARQISGIDHIVVATTANREDDVLEDWASIEEVDLFRGSERNLVERLVSAGDFFDATHIARVTADCPLLDPMVCSDVVSVGLSSNADFASNYCPATYPDGLDFSIIKLEAIKSFWAKGLSDYDLEHVTTVFERNFNSISAVNIRSPEDYSHHRWTLDNTDDLAFLRALCRGIKAKEIRSDHASILEFLSQHPEIGALQSNVLRNYGHEANSSSPHEKPRLNI